MQFTFFLILMFMSPAHGEPPQLEKQKSPGASKLQPAQTRSFRMGFSPWPWDATVEAIDWTYAKIQEHGDVVSHHIEEGVPWNEAKSGAPFPKEMQDDLESRVKRTKSGKVHLLSINALNMGRDAMAPNRGKGINEPLREPWSKYAFNNPDVKLAYANYVERMIKIFKPTWVIFGVESNLLARKGTDAKSQWPAYVELLCSTKKILRNRGIKEPLLVSIVTTAFFPEWSPEDNLNDQKKVLADLDPCVDGYAISVHPFVSGLLAEKFPADYFSRFFAFSKRWVGISESSYPAQVWERDGHTWNGSETKQSQFLEKMFAEANRMNFKFVVWFTARDFDQLWSGLLGKDSISLVWRDTGLYSETGAARSGLKVWMTEFTKPVK